MSIRIRRSSETGSHRRVRSFLGILLVLAPAVGLRWIGCSEQPALERWLSNWAGRIGFSPLHLEAESAALFDPASRSLIYEKRAHKRMYPASTTKILTALIAVENSGPDERVTIGREIRLASRDGSTSGLCEGERMPMRDVVCALMLPSGNDAAYVVACHTASKRIGRGCGSLNEAVSFFVKKMNQRAAEAGAHGSHFTNPDGYHDPDHYSTAYDLSLIASEAMRSSFFRRVVSTRSHEQPVSAKKQRVEKGGGPREQSTPRPARLRFWENRNLLLDPMSSYYFSGANGIKTGHTARAGHCLVASANRRGKRLIAVVLNSTREGVWTDAASLLDYGYQETGNERTYGGSRVHESRRR